MASHDMHAKVLTIWHRNCERLGMTFVDDAFCANSERARTVAVRECFKTTHDDSDLAAFIT
ncbi:hypothetical protein A9762_05830 [Pandoraea sp. ISTKB]|nr:hypothetical protein A9762_05830 [Pandoraea sp. ISTKB]